MLVVTKDRGFRGEEKEKRQHVLGFIAVGAAARAITPTGNRNPEGGTDLGQRRLIALQVFSVKNSLMSLPFSWKLGKFQG